MNYVNLGSSGLKVSRAGHDDFRQCALGMMTFGNPKWRILDETATLRPSG